MLEPKKKADSGATGKETVVPSEKSGDIYQPPVSEDAKDKQTPTEEQGKDKETQEKVSGEDKKQGILTEAKVSEIIARELTKGLRQFQSMSDKSEARVKQLIADSDARMKKIIGRDLTPEEKVALEGDVREEVRNSSEENVDGTQGSDTFEPSKEAKKEFANRVDALEIKYGVRLFQEDEEMKTVNWNERDALKLLRQVESAIKAKAGRSQSDIDSASGAKGRLPALTNESTPNKMKGKKPGELLEEAYPRSK